MDERQNVQRSNKRLVLEWSYSYNLCGYYVCKFIIRSPRVLDMLRTSTIMCLDKLIKIYSSYFSYPLVYQLENMKKGFLETEKCDQFKYNFANFFSTSLLTESKSFYQNGATLRVNKEKDLDFDYLDADGDSNSMNI